MKLEDLKVLVGWPDEDLSEDDKIDKKALELCAREYILLFNHLPPVGLLLDGGTCDPVIIKEVTFASNYVSIDVNWPE